MSFLDNLKKIYTEAELNYKREIKKQADELQRKIEADGRRYIDKGYYTVESRQKGLDIINLLEKRHPELLGSLSMNDLELLDKPKIVFDAKKLGLVKAKNDLFENILLAPVM
jgi:hypothetical protein